MKNHLRQILENTFLLAAGFLLAACATHSHTMGNVNKTEALFYARAELKPTAVFAASGGDVKGTVWFAEGFGKLKVSYEITGLDKSSKHAMHIHEYGDCSAADGSSAGAHYNPLRHKHGDRTEEDRHAGDLGNIVTDKKGVAKGSFEVSGLSINGALNPIVGRGLIIHKNVDDYISQPTGGAGERIACAIIGAATK